MISNKKKGLIVGSSFLLSLVIIFATAYLFNKPAAKVGSKDIVIEVVGSNGKTTDYDLTTDADFLIQAMDELSANGSGFSYSGTDDKYGVMIKIINGEKADYDKDGAYWALYVNGEYGQYGADSQIVENGSTYSWTYEKTQ